MNRLYLSEGYLYDQIEKWKKRAEDYRQMGMKETENYIKCLQINDELLGALERTEQTLRNLANGELSGDAYQIAINEAYNIKAVLAKARGETDE